MGLRPASLLAIVASAILLAGCAQARPVPAGPTEDEVNAIIDRQNREWWQSIAPGEPYPEIEPIKYLDPGENDAVLGECLEAIPTGDQKLWERASFACSMQYPYRVTDPEAMGYLSAAQLDYVYDYMVERLAPCLEFIGYTVGPAPSKEWFVGSDYISWAPYYTMAPQPVDRHEWERIDTRCPVPPVGQFWRPGEDYAVG